MFNVSLDAVSDSNLVDISTGDTKSGKSELQRQLHLISGPPPPPPNELKNISNTVITTQRTVNAKRMSKCETNRISWKSLSALNRKPVTITLQKLI